MTKKPYTPESIDIKTIPGLALTPEQDAIVRQLREQVFTYGKSVGVRYDTLLITDDKEEGFGAGLHEGQLTIRANIEEVRDNIENHIDLEGALKHEIRHTLLNNVVFNAKLRASVGIAENISRIRDVMEKHPEFAEALITERFGSMKNFDNSLRHFEEKVMPVFMACKNNTPKIFSASPEKMVHMIESQDERISAFKTDFEHIGLKELNKLNKRLKYVINGSPHISYQRNESVREIKKFVTSLIQGQEYDADIWAVRNSGDPDSPKQHLQWACKKSPLLAIEEDYHPSLDNRSKMMDYVKLHGEIPPEELFNVSPRKTGFSFGGKKAISVNSVPSK